MTRVKLERLLLYLLATAASINLTNSLGVMLGVTVGAIAIVTVVVTVGAVFFITPVRVFWKHVSVLLLAAAISS
jgi:hypothetical protein